jgi:hypothetical protein
MRLISRQTGRAAHEPADCRARTRVTLARVAGLLVIAACASSGATQVQKSSANEITAEEITRANVLNAYEAVQKLRPAMLRPRQVSSVNGQSKGELLVYVDNNRFGNAETLRQINVASIALLRYYSASEAQMKWGSGHPGGVIEVVTRD